MLQKKLKINQEVFLIILINGQKNKDASGLAYFTIEKDQKINQAKDLLENFFQKIQLKKLMKITGAEIGDSIFFLVEK